MADKRKLAQMLPEEEEKPVLRRGAGLRFSTEPEQTESTQVSAQVHKSTSAQRHSNKQEAVKRVSQGQRLRADLIKAMKRIAVEDERKFYEVMEEAMEQYIQQRTQEPSS